MRTTIFSLLLCPLLTLQYGPHPAFADQPGTVEAILDAAGLTGGLVVHVGATNGRLSAALRHNDAIVVSGLADSSARLAAARTYVASRSLSGPVSFLEHTGKMLPYVDNSVNLLVATTPLTVDAQEVLRVLCPNGVAIVSVDGNRHWLATVDLSKKPVAGGYIMFRKPIPREIDSWTHFLHGPDGHVMSKDTVVAPPHHIQWIGDPQHARSHVHLTTMNVMVTNGKQLFYIIDESPTKLPQLLPGRWAVVARDAFNGVELWRKPLEAWQPYNVRDRNSYPADLHRRLVAVNDSVFVTLSIHGPVSALDVATGKLRRTYAHTENTEDIIVEDGVLYVSVNTGPVDLIDRLKMAYRHTEPRQKRVMAIEAATGKVRWQTMGNDTNELLPMTLAVRGDHVYFQNSRNVVCLDKATGQVCWRASRPSDYFRPGWSAPTLVALDDIVISADRQSGPGQKLGKDQYAAGGFSTGNLIAFDAKTGAQLWTMPCAEGCRAPTDVFNVGDHLWVGEALERRVDYNRVFDVHSGNVVRSQAPPEQWPTWHHHRCYRDKATVNYILAGRTGVEFISLATGELQPHDWIRGTCKLGVMPANGLLYLPPEQCGCYIESKLTGFYVLAPKHPHEAPLTEQHPLLHGIEANHAPSAPPVGDWPTFRADNARSGKATTRVGTKLHAAWQTSIGGRLTQPVVTGGRLFVASIDTNTLHTLDSRTGRPLWQFVTGSRIDSPPTIARGLAVFGCRDGWIYAIRVADGKLVWRYRAAPDAHMLIASGALESVWPVPGSVLVVGPTVYFVAGRSSYIDGGLRMGKLDLLTGRQLAIKTFYARDSESGAPRTMYQPFPAPTRLKWAEMPGLLPDVLSTVGDTIWMRGVNFDRDLQIRDTFAPHLFSSVGFLDDTWWELSYWIYGKHMFGGRGGVTQAAKTYPSARIMVCDTDKVYGYQDGYESINEPLMMAWSKDAKVVTKKIDRKGKKKTSSKVVNYWQAQVPVCAEGLVLAGDTLFLAGSPAIDRAPVRSLLDQQKLDLYRADPRFRKVEATITGDRGGILCAAKTSDGAIAMRIGLPSIPVFDGLIAADQRLYLSLKNGIVMCFSSPTE